MTAEAATAQRTTSRMPDTPDGALSPVNKADLADAPSLLEVSLALLDRNEQLAADNARLRDQVALLERQQADARRTVLNATRIEQQAQEMTTALTRATGENEVLRRRCMTALAACRDLARTAPSRQVVCDTVSAILRGTAT